MHRLPTLLLFLLSCWLPAASEAAGRVEGRITCDGSALVGVSVSVGDSATFVLSGPRGLFAIEDLPEGVQLLSFRRAGHELATREVVVADNATTHLRLDLPHSALPAADVVSRGELQRDASDGRLPHSLRRERGVQIPLSGNHDFHVNLRGINEAQNRRVLVLVDGRDASIPGLGSMEWLSLSTPSTAWDRVELVRGPQSALHGSNAMNGVLSFRSVALHDLEEGGRVRLGLGELGHVRFDLRQVVELGKGWRARFLAGWLRERDFSRDRNRQVEYPGPFWERVGRATDVTESARGGLRLDRRLAHGGRLTLEAETGDLDGWIATTGIGRLQVLDSRRSWGRVAYESDSWSVLASHDWREGDHFSSLNGQHLLLEGSRTQLEGERRFELGESAGRLSIGASFRRESVDSRDDVGRPTALRDASASSGALFGQWDKNLGSRVRLVLAARADVSDLHDTELSSRAGLTWQPSPRHGFRLTYSEGFRSPSLWETALRLPVSGPVGFADVEALLAPSLGGVDLQLGEVEALAVGNASLEVESAGSFELGYRGQLGKRVTLSVDVHRERLRDLVSFLVPNTGTDLGRLNEDYGPYRPPAELTPEQQQLVLDVLAAELPQRVLDELSNDADGRPILAKLTHANVADVEVEGIDLALGIALAEHWMLDVAYSWQDFDWDRRSEDISYEANAPEQAASFSVQHLRGPWDASLSFRWVDGHAWSVGDFGEGDVPSYELLDLSANWRLSDELSLGLNVTNLLDDRHREIWGGDVLGRRGVASVAIRW